MSSGENFVTVVIPAFVLAVACVAVLLDARAARRMRRRALSSIPVADMPLYFAYGANMDAAAMAQRCPVSRLIGGGHLPRHRFIMMREGYASVIRDPARTVWGVLWELDSADIPALDRYEGVAGGLYTKATLPVRTRRRRQARPDLSRRLHGARPTAARLPRCGPGGGTRRATATVLHQGTQRWARGRPT